MSDLHRYYARGEYGRHLGRQRELAELRRERNVKFAIAAGWGVVVAAIAWIAFH